MPEFSFQDLDLDKDSIRLLQIEQGSRFDRISCSLFEAFLDPDQCPTYKALSYTWGGGENSRRILVNNHEFEITANLYSALWHIRRSDEDVLLWVDAICINQKNDREKGHQVNQMGRVYSAAEEVLVWLGPPSNGDTEELIQSIDWIDINVSKAKIGRNSADWASLCRHFMIQRLGSPGSHAYLAQRQALEELLKNRWFRRIWILQEVAMARSARIHCGSFSCPARTFGLMPLVMELGVNQSTQAVLDIMPRVRKNTWWSSRRDLQHLLKKFARSRATDPRDMIYALLSMSEDAHNPKQFFPSYEKTINQVCQDTACFIMFGEILDFSQSLPEFSLGELYPPTTEMVERTLRWALHQPFSQPGDHGSSAKRVAVLLADRLNQGQLETDDLLLSISWGALREKMEALLSHLQRPY
ncbi:HET-domain-containing [Fusarium albosuccineum]|uniref:HET-domain-containing n=1 Tax=Fusarium albosuccineum TaxID=1237068 RepID=A0A8H4KHH1_9HYPO|nr:HET-domain-containing [Fusarium albosuccineum]